jgi:hypothetical protein
MISWLSFMAVFLFLLNSCVHDEMYSASDPAAKEYHSKSLWKEDEIYIKNIIKIYEEHEAEIRKEHGTPLWEYAMTMDKFDESYLVVPVRKNGRIMEVMEVPRFGRKVYFRYSDDDEKVALFNQLMIDRPKKPLPVSSANAASKIVCVVKTFSTWYPDNENNPSGSGHWETSSYTICIDLTIDTFENPDDGGGNGGYDYPPFGGGYENPEDSIVVNQTPCEKTKNILDKPQVQQIINDVKTQALKTLSDTNAGELGFKEKKDGTIAPADINASHKVVYNDVTDGYGGYHNHTALGTHMFSPPDIADTLLGFAAAQDNVSDAYFGMIAAEWCNCPPSNKQYIHYVMQYTGPAADIGTGGSYNFTQVQVNQFISDYLSIIKDLTNKSLNGTTYIKNNAGDLNEKGLEKLFFETLTVMGMDGKVNLQRIGPSGTVFNVNLDSNNMPVATPCPN